MLFKYVKMHKYKTHKQIFGKIKSYNLKNNNYDLSILVKQNLRFIIDWGLNFYYSFES